MGTEKPYAPACDKNKDPILRVPREQFTRPEQVLEIGSGTGQHAVHFASFFSLFDCFLVAQIPQNHREIRRIDFLTGGYCGVFHHHFRNPLITRRIVPAATSSDRLFTQACFHLGSESLHHPVEAFDFFVGFLVHGQGCYVKINPR